MRLIDADAVKLEIKKWQNTKYDFRTLKQIVDSMPTIEAEPVRHGRWIAGTYTYLCSECEQRTRHTAAKFCPECGAKMDGGAENAAD